jgi:hypothetical protein
MEGIGVVEMVHAEEGEGKDYRYPVSFLDSTIEKNLRKHQYH